MKNKKSYSKVNKYMPMISLTFLIIELGAVFYHLTENWSWLDSVYFSVITLTTIGYGDLAPTKAITKIFTIFYVFVGIAIIVGFINLLAKRR